MGKSEEEVILPPVPEGARLVSPGQPQMLEQSIGLPSLPEGAKLVLPPPTAIEPETREMLKQPIPGYEVPPTAAELRQPAKLDIGQIVKDTLSGALKDFIGTLTGTGEAAMTVASGIPSYIAGVGAQAGKTIYDYWKAGFREIESIDPKVLLPQVLEKLGQNEEVRDKVAALGTYVPETPEGESFAQVATAPFELFFLGVDEIAKLMTDDPDIQKGIRFLGDVALIYGLPKAKRAFARKKAINKGEVLREINESKAIPEEIKAKAHKVNKYPFFPKDAPQVWYDVWDATSGRGIRPFKDPAGKFIELEEYRSGVPKQLRRKDSPYAPDEVADLLRLEDSQQLYRTLRFTEDMREIMKPRDWEAEAAAFEEEFARAKVEKPPPEITVKPTPEQMEGTIRAHMEGKTREQIAEIRKGLPPEEQRVVDKILTEKRPERPVEPQPPVEKEVPLPPEEPMPRVEWGPEVESLSKKAERYPADFEGFRESLQKKGQLESAEATIKDSPYKSLEELWREVAEEKVPEFKVKEEWRVEKPKEEQARIAERRAEEALKEIGKEEEGFEYVRTADEIAEEVKAKLKYEGPDVGLTVKPTEAFLKKEKPFKFEPEIESRFESAKGVKKASIPEQARNVLVSAKNKITRTYEHLPNTAEFIELKTSLKTLAKQGGVSSDKAIRTMQGITIRLDKSSQDLFRRKVILDDLAREVEAGHDLPFGFTKDILKTEKARLDSVVGTKLEVLDAIKKRNRLWDALKNDYVYWAKKAGVDLESKITKEDYFRHQVLQYARNKGIAHTGKRLRIPSKREFLKERKGSEFDINTDYFEAEYEVMAQMLYDIEIYKAVDRIGKKYDISAKVKADAKKQSFDDWHEAIPEGYVAWQPREGNVFYMADTIPARIAEQILDGTLTEMGVVREKLTKSLSMGRKRMEWVIKEEAAKTLNDLTQRTPPSWLTRLSKNALRLWKVWTLISPRRFAKYNIRNMTGDADAAFVGNPRGFKKMPKAIEELMDIYSADRPMPKEMREWFDRGGMETTLQAQELGDIKALRTFQKFYESKGGIEKIPERAWKKYWRTARLTTDFREAILRYANYLDYLEQMKKNPGGKPNNFGASIPEEIMGLSDIRDRAFRLSNELLGAYDEISVFGQALRNHVYPFWSWKELNFKRYIRLFKNAAKDNGVASTVGRKLLSTGLRTPYMALRVGKFAIKATAFWSLLQVWNHTMFPEEEKLLPKEVKGRAHIIFGQDKEGNIVYFTRLGALTDFLEWFGLDVAPNLVSSFLSGKKSMKDIATEMAKAPVNQVVQGLSPFYKIPLELATRRSLFPDVFEPGTVRDRGLHFARGLALENEYKAIMGKPGKPYIETLPLSAVYKVNPLEAAYHEIYDIKNEYLKGFGKRGEGFWLTPRGSALYDMKLAHRYGDKEAERKAHNAYIQYHLIEYAETGKSEEDTAKSIVNGIISTLVNMHPLSGMNKNERKTFVEGLNVEEKELLAKAIKFYTETLIGTTPFEEEE